ncbi:MAG: MFS transporter [Lentisphaerae bacterium]|jgi:MFS family permease|nr:MFS transporter [Lentisphaerota bacterium]MBT5609905.1 MFS transporter [Lentisphaerota bacterium]MBT7061416.1 MFS transporter [Lentisphaerota bacterium]MBT7847494.1 MFS transporter [Lentisphaerota bacterium]
MAQIGAHLLSEKEKNMLFWASFLALAAAGFGFVFRVMIPDIWAAEFTITAEEVGSLTGAALWPLAITMIIFSLLVDVIGYKNSMYIAFVLQTFSVILTLVAKNTSVLWWACFCAGLGHGIVEAVINPLCATMYRTAKSKMLNILHAAWPAGIVAGGTIYLTMDRMMAWRGIFLFMLLPIIAYGIMFTLCHRYPVDERVEANVPMKDMLKEFGGLGIFLATTFLFYELGNHLGIPALKGNLTLSLIVGGVAGVSAGVLLKAKGKILFFVCCLIMIPLATAELATDTWIQSLMRPVLAEEYTIRSGWAIVCSAGIMMFLRFFAGVPLKYMSPPALLLFSSVCSIFGLYLLSGASGLMIFAAFVAYAVGQTFYWPTMQGLVAEQFPKGGAMTLNTVAAMGLLTVGIFGFPFLGAVKDSYDAKAVSASRPELYAKYKIEDKAFFGVKYDSIKRAEVLADESLDAESKTVLTKEIDRSARKTIRVAAVLPTIMAIAFILMLVWFKTQGGYKAIHLEAAADEGAGDAEGANEAAESAV